MEETAKYPANRTLAEFPKANASEPQEQRPSGTFCMYGNIKTQGHAKIPRVPECHPGSGRLWRMPLELRATLFLVPVTWF